MATARASKPRWNRGPEIRAPRDYVCFNLPDPCTHADVVRRIAERFKLRLDPLPKCLSQFTMKGKSWHVDGSASDCLNGITQHHENLYWTVSDGALRFEVRAGGNLSPCVELAGRLWHDASRGANGRVSDAALARITAQLDNRGFKPVQQLEGKDRGNVGRYNRMHPDKAVHTFSDAVKRKLLTVTDPKSDRLKEWRFSPRHAVRRWLSRCGKKWEKVHPAA